MYTLIIEDNHGRSAAEISFDQGNYTIGRVDGNDVVLSSNSVSRTHARIFVSNNKCYIDDLGSANGVYVDGVQIKERTEIRNGSKIRIGEYTLYLEYKDQNEMNAGQDVLKTQIVSSGQSGYKIVRIMDKFAGEEFMLSEASNTIGRTEDNYILLSDQSISRNHARIINKAMTFFVSDLDSSNGTFLNNKKITSECQLHTGDQIRFGNVSFVFVPASQRVDLSQYIKKKSSDNKTLMLALAILIVCVFIIIVVAVVWLMNDQKEKDQLSQQQNQEAVEEAKAAMIKKQIDRANHLFQDNELSDAKEIVESLQKEVGNVPEIIKLNEQINFEFTNSNFLRDGNEFIESKKYEKAIAEFNKIDSESRFYKTAKENILDAKHRMRLSEYNDARADCDSGSTPECIRKLCDAALNLDEKIPDEKAKISQTVEYMKLVAKNKNKKNKSVINASNCLESLEEKI